ncbi:CotS family spore coat protein [Bacillus sp. FJAT-47783]|uniref:CotS family spore coat protein n=1 Tax=Bacillus sp. FJAT-47783 TaxID=2922712 RepID=UPI001FAC0411|nr:CotS family spore coat protein [Bacillus sp. FJAT-47783]
MIGPWLEEVEKNPELNDGVPQYLEEMAKKVITYYDVKVAGMALMATKPHKGAAIWRIDTDNGPIGLKVLHRKNTRSLFSIGAQHYLVEQGARVPKVIPTIDGKDCVEAGGKLWIVTEWIQPFTMLNQDFEGSKALASALGEFHRLSKGYVSPKGADTPSRLFKWPNKYEKMITKLNWFRNIAELYNETEASSSILSVIDRFQQEGYDALARLEQSPYHDLCYRGESYWGIVHQDYGWGNAQMGPNGVWIIDLDGVSYDIPVHDLRTFITRILVKIGWNKQWISEVVQAYHQMNPMEKDLYRILLIDLAFPHEFYILIKNIVYEPMNFLNDQLDIAIQNLQESEANKFEILHELEKEWKEKGLC